MHKATRKMAIVARTYASQVPLPSSAHTSGIVAAGVVVGAIVETDCARVSRGERIPRRKPKSPLWVLSGGVGSIPWAAPPSTECNWGGIVQHSPRLSSRQASHRLPSDVLNCSSLPITDGGWILPPRSGRYLRRKNRY